MDLQAALPVSFISTWRFVRTWARAGPLKFGEEDLSASAATGVSTAQAACHAPASVAVTAVTGYPSFFGCRVRAASSSERRSQQVMRLLRGYTISSRTSFFGSHL